MTSVSPTGPTRSWEGLRGHCEECPKDIQLAYMQPCSPQTHASQTCHSHLPSSEVAFLQISCKLTGETLFLSWVLDLKKTCYRDQVADPRMEALLTFL